jgi:hypothetical protein
MESKSQSLVEKRVHRSLTRVWSRRELLSSPKDILKSFLLEPVNGTFPYLDRVTTAIISEEEVILK